MSAEWLIADQREAWARLAAEMREAEHAHHG
jgi:hypothetical protein